MRLLLNFCANQLHIFTFSNFHVGETQIEINFYIIKQTFQMVLLVNMELRSLRHTVVVSPRSNAGCPMLLIRTRWSMTQTL